jgi:hypothetical protein
MKRLKLRKRQMMRKLLKTHKIRLIKRLPVLLRDRLLNRKLKGLPMHKEP